MLRSLRRRVSPFGFRRFASSKKANGGSTEEGGFTIVGVGEGGGEIVAPYGDNSPRPRHNLLTLPLSRRPLFPGYMSAIMVKDKAIIDAVIKGREDGTGGYIGLFLRRDNGMAVDQPDLITDLSQIHDVGTFAQVHNVIKLDQGGAQMLVMGHRRISLKSVESYGPPVLASVDHWRKLAVTEQTNALKAYSNEIVSVAREIIKLNPLAQEQMQQWVSRVELTDPFKLADFAAVMTTADGAELQAVLEAADPEERLKLALDLLSKEKELAKLQRDISKQVEDKMSKSQREYFLREQLKSIKQELGLERDDKDELLGKYSERMRLLEGEKRLINPEALRVIQDEVRKLGTLEKNSPEFNVTRSYLDWLTSIPWGTLTVDSLDVAAAKRVLDVDHFGMSDIKRRILEFIAVGQLRGTVSGKILCFIGPPGVGKTSIAKSIATALNRTFYRFSVGGLTDIAEIKGHRRTYIGAMPGKPVQSLKSTGCVNPVILIDEIDKLGRGYQGDPASALLELLDPNQNTSFVDHYLDVPVDFSNVLFVCTANDESTIPGPLKDRMEVIRLSGYDIPEKVAIATRYLVPKALKESGFGRRDEEESKKGSVEGGVEGGKESGVEVGAGSGVEVVVTEGALEALVKNYCRESGVRSLEKHIERIVRKAAYAVVSQDGADVELKLGVTSEPPCQDANPHDLASDAKIKVVDNKIVVTAANLEDFVGKARFTQDTIYEGVSVLPSGVVMGLAWNPMGGSPVYIETAAIPIANNDGGGSVNVITGQLGNVMKESVNIAYTFARQLLSRKEPSNVFFKQNQLHLHVPEGAVEKDGPSAGVAMAVSLISLAIDKPVRPRVAMTGELTLTGKVLPVGGIKEKVLAARRSGADTVILPLANKRDFDELPTYVKANVKVHFASDFNQVFAVCFES